MSILPVAFRNADLSRTLNPRDLPDVRDHFFGPFEEQFNRFFDDFFAVKRKPLSHGFPKVDLYTHDEKFVIEYAMAGVDPADVTIELSDEPHDFGSDYGRKLKVSGKMSKDFEHVQDAVYHVKEMSRKSFTRTVILPENVKSDPVATFKNGMLTLTFELPKKEEDKPKVKNITIQTEEEGK
jgi:HSP20 family molecular chaperone IbpA